MARGSLRFAVLCAAALCVGHAPPVVAQAAPVIPEAQALTDDWVYRLANKGFFLRNTIRYAVLGDDALRAYFLGDGAPAACMAFEKSFAAVAPYEAEFRTLAIAAMRAQVPEERLRTARGAGILYESPLILFKIRVETELKATAGNLYARAEASFRETFAKQLDAARRRSDLPPVARIRLDAQSTNGLISIACVTYQNDNRALFETAPASNGER